jgi:hypothetical protein
MVVSAIMVMAMMVALALMRRVLLLADIESMISIPCVAQYKRNGEFSCWLKVVS